MWAPAPPDLNNKIFHIFFLLLFLSVDMFKWKVWKDKSVNLKGGWMKDQWSPRTSDYTLTY